jgi:DNA helicase IV
MAVADRLLRAEGRSSRAQVAARQGSPPVVVAVARIDLEALEHVVAPELEALGGGRLAVVFPRDGFTDLAEQLHLQVTGSPRPARAVMLDESLVTLDVGEVKGLEFDTVVVVEPALVLAQSRRGVGDLYVAMTRPTQRLVVVHSGDLPASLRSEGTRSTA